MREQTPLNCELQSSQSSTSSRHCLSLSDLTDIDIITKNLNSTYFPGVSDSVWVHGGFADEQAKTASIVLDATNSIISSKGADTVICVSALHILPLQ